MRRPRLALALVTGSVLLSLIGEAGAAAEFSPTIEFTIGDRNANVNSTFRVVVKQDTGEEELQSVELRVPAGFSLAVDQQLTAGERIGSGTIVIDSGPRCAGTPAGSAPATVPVNIVEQDRTSAQIASGVAAVYVVDLRPVTSIVLEVTGSPEKGWTLAGPIPGNNATCPPFTFDATFQQRAQTSQTPILVNPSLGGDYEFSATFKGVAGGTSTTKQVVTIEGGGGGGGETLTDDSAARKKCKRIKNKKRRKRCLKKLRD